MREATGINHKSSLYLLWRIQFVVSCALFPSFCLKPLIEILHVITLFRRFRKYAVSCFETGNLCSPRPSLQVKHIHTVERKAMTIERSISSADTSFTFCLLTRINQQRPENQVCPLARNFSKRLRQRRSQNEAEEAMASPEKNLLRFFAGVLYQSQLLENKQKKQSDSCSVVFSH